ncbi:MAG: hypothetical protein V4857_14520 [Pseudomonadota bacterium]
MKKLKITSLATMLILAACSERVVPTSNAAVAVANEYCAQDYKPYQSIVDACVAERKNGKRGVNCASFDQIDALLLKRKKESNFKECRPPEVRFGPNARNN